MDAGCSNGVGLELESIELAKLDNVVSFDVLERRENIFSIYSITGTVVLKRVIFL